MIMFENSTMYSRGYFYLTLFLLLIIGFGRGQEQQEPQPEQHEDVREQQKEMVDKEVEVICEGNDVEEGKSDVTWQKKI